MIFAGSPLWLDFVVLLALCAAAFELSRMLGKRVLQAADAGDADSSETHALSGVFGLLALLMAFSFGMALDRYEERRALVVAEANALGTFASRVALLPEEDAAAVRTILGQYAGARLAFGRAVTDDQAEDAYAHSDAVHARMGAAIYASLARGPADPRGPALLQPFNEAGDLAAERLAVREAHLPDAVLLLLCLFCVAGAAMLGYSRAGSPRAHRPASLAFLTLLAVAFITVLDLDRPRGGSILVPQEAMERQAEPLIAALHNEA
jgi:hypothetical protein